jgi:putative membrane protein
MVINPETTAGDVAWSRLHPLSPALRFGRLLVPLLVVLLPSAASPGTRHGPPLVDIAVLGLGLVGGLVSWLVTRWRLVGAELQIETGLLRHQSIRVPLSRVQAVDVVRPLLGRFLGLSEVRVIVAGGGRDRTRLAYLGDERAWEVRAALLAGSRTDVGEPHRTEPSAVAMTAPSAGTVWPPHPLLRVEAHDPSERRLFDVSNGRLIGSSLLTSSTVIVLLVLGASLGATVALGGPATAAVFIPVLISFGGVAARRVVAEYELSVSRTPDGLRVYSGLLQTRTESVPDGRVQAVRWIEPMAWVPFGWCRLEVDVARQTSSRRGQGSGVLTRALVPVGTHDQALAVLREVMPGADVTAPAGSGPPRRAVLRAPLLYRNLRAWTDGERVLTRTGRFTRVTVIVPLAKAQSIRLGQGPYQRRLGLATVHVDLPGRGWHGVARCRAAQDAHRMVFDLAESARLARRRSAAGAHSIL